MTELEKVEYAKSFIEKLANGINPLDDTPIPESDIANNVRLSKCFSYVSDVLGQLVENGKKKEKKRQKPKRNRFYITAEQLQNFPYSQEPITLGEFCNRLESLVDLSKVKHISRGSLPKWLVFVGLISPPNPGERHYGGEITEEGLKMGIDRITYTNKYGTHKAYVLGIEAQRFVIDNVDAFFAFRERGRWSI